MTKQDFAAVMTWVQLVLICLIVLVFMWPGILYVGFYLWALDGDVDWLTGGIMGVVAVALSLIWTVAAF